ncbi:hypothetical protein COOONC_27519, partial [Cooperia oncophora]
MLLRYRGVNATDEQQERRNEAIGRRIFPSTSGPSTSNNDESNLPSAERLKVSIRRNRDRQISDKFDFGPTPKKSSLSLGIVRKTVKREAEEDEYENTVVTNGCATVNV